MKLSSAKSRYATFNRALQSIYLTIKQFRFYVDGCEFSIFTGHKSWVNVLRTKTDHSLIRQCIHLDFIGRIVAESDLITNIDINKIF